MNSSDKQISIIPNINTLLKIAFPRKDKNGEIIDLYYETIVAWRVETDQTGYSTYESSATPITISGEFVATDHPGAIYNKFTEEWDIPSGQSGKGRDKLLKYFQTAKQKTREMDL